MAFLAQPLPPNFQPATMVRPRRKVCLMIQRGVVVDGLPEAMVLVVTHPGAQSHRLPGGKQREGGEDWSGAG